MLQWFIRFPEFAEITEFNESSAPFRKNSNVVTTDWILDLIWLRYWLLCMLLKKLHADSTLDFLCERSMRLTKTIFFRIGELLAEESEHVIILRLLSDCKTLYCKLIENLSIDQSLNDSFEKEQG